MFCSVRGRESIGSGKLIYRDDAVCIVEYFHSPVSTERETIEISPSELLLNPLGPDTRVYYFDEVSANWMVGRVREDDGEDGVEVRFTDKNDVFIPYEHLFVRCKRPIADPTVYLANFITETPRYAEGRSQFLASYVKQRGVTGGITSLLSSSVELEHHQVAVVRRVLNDPSQRYLLADEVGLGKTIEAGIVIRQAVLDDPVAHHITILVPQVLLRQWHDELTRRFALGDFLGDSVVIISHEESLADLATELAKSTMIVIDEAHHIVRVDSELAINRYQIIEQCSKQIERLLLLSATPVLRNEAGFLGMLHLLDPVIYRLEDLESFREKVTHRQLLGETVAMLDPQNALVLDESLDELESILPNDETLSQLIEPLRSILETIPDEDDETLVDAIGRVRSHLSETYKLNRRILRNRRSRVKFLTPDRRGGEKKEIDSSNIAQIEALIEAWRFHTSKEIASEASSVPQVAKVDFHWELIASLLTNPEIIVDLCVEYLGSMSMQSNTVDQEEVELLERLMALSATGDWLDVRLLRLVDIVKKLLVDSVKIVLFCSDEKVADATFDVLEKQLKGAVVRHSVVDEDDDRELLWLAFNYDPGVQILVCDKQSEEGINLQGGSKLVLHFDLPIEPNRVEQRLGRVDRYGSGGGIRSIVLTDEGSRYQEYWYEFMDSVFKVFDQSISSLQYLVESELKKLKRALYFEGVDALILATEGLGDPQGGVALELREIDQQDMLDELTTLTDDDLDGLFDVDADWRSLRQGIDIWAHENLLFGKTPKDTTLSNSVPDPATHYVYQTPGPGKIGTLISQSLFLDNFFRAIDFDSPRSNSRQPLSHAHCARRQDAVRGGHRPLRYGDEFVEALKAFSDVDDRGRSFAIWRQLRDGYSASGSNLYFQFDFLVEAGLLKATNELEQGGFNTRTGIAAIARRGDALFPPFVERVWVDEEGDEVDRDFITDILEAPYDNEGSDSKYVDTNLKLFRFRKLVELESERFDNWQGRCNFMREKALNCLKNRSELLDAKNVAIRRGQTEDQLRYAQLSTRLLTLTGDEQKQETAVLALERKIAAGLYAGIQEPSIKVDVAGLVILSPLGSPV